MSNKSEICQSDVRCLLNKSKICPSGFVKALFHEVRENYLVLLSYCFVTFLIGGSVILLFALNIKWSLTKLKEIVGSSFVEEYYPPSIYKIRGLGPVLISGLTVSFLMVFDYFSLKWYEICQVTKIDQMREQINQLIETSQEKAAVENLKAIVSEMGKFTFIKGFFTQLMNSPTITYYMDFFRINKSTDFFSRLTS